MKKHNLKNPLTTIIKSQYSKFGKELKKLVNEDVSLIFLNKSKTYFERILFGTILNIKYKNIGENVWYFLFNPLNQYKYDKQKFILTNIVTLSKNEKIYDDSELYAHLEIDLEFEHDQPTFYIQFLESHVLYIEKFNQLNVIILEFNNSYEFREISDEKLKLFEKLKK